MSFPIRTYKICPKCSNYTRIEEKENYCNLCGTKMIDACQKCSEPIRLPHSKFCTNCGHSLLEKTNPKATYPFPGQ